MPHLDSELNIIDVLGPDGILGEQIDGFQSRESQLAMAELISQSISNCENYIIEASTGIGKSFAYLVPAFLSDKKVLISTGTRNLQDQLFQKDIPLIRKTIVSSKKVALLKGRSNYCCPFRIKKYRQERRFQTPQMTAVFNALQDWADYTRVGDITEFADIPENDSLWFYATSTADNCLGGECPEFKNCFVMKARIKAMEANILVINHHLFFSDLALKEDGFGEILPEVDVVIFDEAHQLPDIASHFFGQGLTMRQIEGLCRDIVEAQITEAKESKDIQNISDQLRKAVADFRLMLGRFPQKAEWKNIRFAPPVVESTDNFKQHLDVMEQELEKIIHRGKELAVCHKRVQSVAQTLESFLNPTDIQVAWYEWNERSFRLMLSPVEIAEQFRNQMEANEYDTVIFTSATLSSQNSFDYFANRLGIGEMQEIRYPSPFDFQKQAMLYIPTHLPDPSSEAYLSAFVEICIELIEASGGFCFILFTSYRMLSLVAKALKQQISNPLFIQGELQRSELLQQYLQADKSVLLGTSSFWEGVDVKGDRLRCVIIDKLPFKSPSDPLYKRRLQLVSQRQGNAFTEVQIPETTISLRQGVGRLIRDSNDRGIVMLADNRLNTKSYAKQILLSLPDMKRCDDLQELKNFVKNKFRKKD